MASMINYTCDRCGLPCKGGTYIKEVRRNWTELRYSPYRYRFEMCESCYGDFRIFLKTVDPKPADDPKPRKFFRSWFKKGK